MKNQETIKGLSRRAFVGLGATAAAAVGVAGLAGCAPQPNEDPGTPGGPSTASEPDFLLPPVTPQNVQETRDCEVLILGLGLSGIAAARAASEAGVTVIGVEKQAQPGVISLSGDFGIYGSQVQADLGMELADKAEVVNQLMKDMTFRPDGRLIGYWYDNSGADFDWMIEEATYEVVPTSAATPSGESENIIRPKCYPVLEGYDRQAELFPFFNGSVTTEPSVQWCVDSCAQIAQENGAEFMFNTFADQLIRNEEGRVTGAYVRDTNDNFTQINASRAVILCCGDFSGNPEMLDYYVPWVEGISPFYPNLDAEGNVANTGDGQRMGMWAGGHMEKGPLAPMTHHLGAALGIDAFLQLNIRGERFMNEDIPGQNIQDQLNSQPEMRSWQIIDSSWRDQLGVQGTGHGYVNYYIPDAEADQWPAVVGEEAIASFTGYTTDSMFLQAITHQADTLEELAELMEVPVETAVASIERYNEMARNGVDEDFGKNPRRLFPVENPPYYACEFGDSGMLVCMGGLDCDTSCRVLGDDMLPIPGLYVAGNTMGRRFSVEYPVTQAGISLSMALTFGRLAGTMAASEE